LDKKLEHLLLQAYDTLNRLMTKTPPVPAAVVSSVARISAAA